MDGSSTPFDSVKPRPELPEVGAPGKEKIIADPRQQRKLICALEGDDNAISKQDAAVSYVDYAKFLEKIRKGAVTKPQVNEVLSRIATPFGSNPELFPEQAKHVLADLSPNSQGRAIIAYFTKNDMSLRDSLTPEDVLKFFNDNPLPSDFQDTLGADFLSELEVSNSSEKVAEYKDSMRGMMRTVFGKRMEYSDQWRLLKEASGVDKPKPRPNYTSGVPNQGNNLNDPTIMGPAEKEVY